MNIITGMHRSGTSLVARLCHLAGADLGNPETFYPGDRWNPAGYFEQLDIHAVNIPLVNGAWGKLTYLAPPSTKTILWRARKQAAQIARTAEDYRGKIVKDCRFCVTLPGWIRHHAQVDRLLVCLREPDEVARSLKKRNRATRRHALHLWWLHYQRLLENAWGLPVWLVNYENLRKEATFQIEMRSVFDFLKIEAADDVLRGLYRDHVTSSSSRGGGQCRRYPDHVDLLWQRLRELHARQRRTQVDDTVEPIRVAPVTRVTTRARVQHQSTATPTISRLSVMMPVYNSERTVGLLVDALVETLAPRYTTLEVILVNDGSKDDSDTQARQAHQRHPHIVKYLRLARNFGEHNAVMCGLRHMTGDCVAIIDDDFQNPVNEIPLLVTELCRGFDVVYSRYPKKQHHWLRNVGSWFNGWVASKLLSVPRGVYLSSFKVMRASLVRTVLKYEGPFPYLDGLIFRSTDSISTVEVRHAARQEGRSNYTLRRLVRLWLNMFTGFSIVPLRVASMLGIVMSVAGVLMAAFFVVSALTGGILSQQAIPPGWASLIVSVTLFSGIQLCVLGMAGEYIGRVFMTQNRTPQYVVAEQLGIENVEDERKRYGQLSA